MIFSVSVCDMTAGRARGIMGGVSQEAAAVRMQSAATIGDLKLPRRCSRQRLMFCTSSERQGPWQAVAQGQLNKLRLPNRGPAFDLGGRRDAESHVPLAHERHTF